MENNSSYDSGTLSSKVVKKIVHKLLSEVILDAILNSGLPAKIKACHPSYSCSGGSIYAKNIDAKNQYDLLLEVI